MEPDRENHRYELDDRAPRAGGRGAVTTNSVNAQDQAFFADLHDAFDRLDAITLTPRWC